MDIYEFSEIFIINHDFLHAVFPIIIIYFILSDFILRGFFFFFYTNKGIEGIKKEGLENNSRPSMTNIKKLKEK